MAALAGMIDRVDQELGRLFSDLDKAGELDNTLILFVSDNGSCPYDRRVSPIDSLPYDPANRWGDSTGWAWARNAPFRYYKQNQFEGGIATPLIAHWPAGIKQRGSGSSGCGTPGPAMWRGPEGSWWLSRAGGSVAGHGTSRCTSRRAGFEDAPRRP